MGSRALVVELGHSSSSPCFVVCILRIVWPTVAHVLCECVLWSNTCILHISSEI